MMPNLIELLPQEYWDSIDENVKIFCREIRKELRREGHVVIGLTGYPGTGKSTTAAIIGALIDERYNFETNICFIPTSKEIGEKYLGLPMYSFFHIDEASRGLHKHKWFDKVQQKLNELYDTEREGHFLCTLLIMPRFQNFTENFRNFMITYWIHIHKKGIVLFFKKDPDKDVKDPWHLDESYKIKLKQWEKDKKRVFERTLSDIIRTEQITTNYWFYAQIPAIPKEVWELYQKLKKESRIIATKEPEEIKVKGPSDLRMERTMKYVDLHNKGYKDEDASIELNISMVTLKQYKKFAIAKGLILQSTS